MSELRRKLEFEIRKLALTGFENQSGLVETAVEAYETARMDGLCHEGAWEVAISAARRGAPQAPADAQEKRDIQT